MSIREVASALWRRLQGKVAIITGGAGGIGEATVRLFANHGAKVIIADISDDASVKVAESLSPWATYVHCDVSKEEDVSAAVDLAMEKHGKLDIMYNNAGVVDNQKLSVAEYDMLDFERVMNINVKGVMHGIKHASRVMIPNRKGSIISTSSVAGILGGATPYFYTASKHAIIGLTKNGAAQLGIKGYTCELYFSCCIAHGSANEADGNDAFSRGKGKGGGNASNLSQLKRSES